MESANGLLLSVTVNRKVTMTIVILGWIYLQHTRILVAFLTHTLLHINVPINPRRLPVRYVYCFKHD